MEAERKQTIPNQMPSELTSTVSWPKSTRFWQRIQKSLSRTTGNAEASELDFWTPANRELGWIDEDFNSSIHHVYPQDDIVAHEVDYEGECICGPSPIFAVGGMLYEHHSLDGREFAETGFTSHLEPRMVE
jgi:hypothetical protein